MAGKNIKLQMLIIVKHCNIGSINMMHYFLNTWSKVDQNCDLEPLKIFYTKRKEFLSLLKKSSKNQPQSA